jgi:hypothetical protein
MSILGVSSRRVLLPFQVMAAEISFFEATPLKSIDLFLVRSAPVKFLSLFLMIVWPVRYY